jgi:dTDP-4-dehydrorhamnose 3,5-epimerase
MVMISGVEVKQLKRIPDERGMLMEILRSDEPLFEKFGQVYVSTVYPGVVKGWHLHKTQTDNIVILKGMAKLVIYDEREGSPTRGEVQELFVGEQNPVLVKIPPHLWHGMKGVGPEPAYMLNCPTEAYNYERPDEYRRPPDDPKIPYDWGLKHG